jgi:hypothetical protein
VRAFVKTAVDMCVLYKRAYLEKLSTFFYSCSLESELLSGYRIFGCMRYAGYVVTSC